MWRRYGQSWCQTQFVEQEDPRRLRHANLCGAARLPTVDHAKRPDELIDGHTAGQRPWRGADPCEECPLVGEGEAIVRLMVFGRRSVFTHPHGVNLPMRGYSGPSSSGMTNRRWERDPTTAQPGRFAGCDVEWVGGVSDPSRVWRWSSAVRAMTCCLVIVRCGRLEPENVSSHDKAAEILLL